MAIFKCKMCGGELSVAEEMKIVECDFCGTAQTVPSVMDENRQNLFNRANTLRMKGEFDKAEQIYEKIINGEKLSGKEKEHPMFILLHNFWSCIKEENLQASKICLKLP